MKELFSKTTQKSLVTLMFLALLVLPTPHLHALFDDLLILHKGEGLGRDKYEVVQFSNYYKSGSYTNEEHALVKFIIDKVPKLDKELNVPGHGVLELIYVSKMSRSKLLYINNRDSSVAFLKAFSYLVSANREFKVDLEILIAKLQFPKSRYDNSDGENSHWFKEFIELTKEPRPLSVLPKAAIDTVAYFFPVKAWSTDSIVLAHQGKRSTLYEIGIHSKSVKSKGVVYVFVVQATNELDWLGLPKEILDDKLVDPDLNSFFGDSVKINSTQLILTGCSRRPIWVVMFETGKYSSLEYFDAVTGKHIDIGDCDLRHDYFLRRIPRP